jgi:hypothetical protein
MAMDDGILVIDSVSQCVGTEGSNAGGMVVVPPGSVIIPSGGVSVPTGPVIIPGGGVSVPTGPVVVAGGVDLLTAGVIVLSGVDSVCP